MLLAVMSCCATASAGPAAASVRDEGETATAAGTSQRATAARASSSRTATRSRPRKTSRRAKPRSRRPGKAPTLRRPVKAPAPQPSQQVAAGDSLTMQAGREFAADSHVHKPLAPNEALAPNSAGQVGELLKQIKRHYGTVTVNTHQYAPPVYVVDAGQPTMRVRAWDRGDASWRSAPLQEKWSAVPVPDDFRASPGSDQEAVIYQPSTGRYWEFWQMQKTGAKTKDSSGRIVPEWGARWGGRMDDIAGNPGYFTDPSTAWDSMNGTKWGTAATGLPLMAGMMSIEEQQRGRIDHVLHIALVEVVRDSWTWPAQRSDGQLDSARNPNAIRQGTTFRLPASLDLDAIDMDPYARMIARAVQRHGLVVRDKGGAVALFGENPAGRYAEDPYTRRGGILRCPNGESEQSCWANSGGRLRGFPWDKLQVVQRRHS